MKRRSLSKFANRNWSVSFSNDLLKKIDHTINEAAVFKKCNIFSGVN